MSMRFDTLEDKEILTSACATKNFPLLIKVNKSKQKLYYNTIYYNTIYYNTIYYNTIYYNTIYYNTIYYNTIHYNTIHYNKIYYNTIYYKQYICDNIICLLVCVKFVVGRIRVLVKVAFIY